MEFPGMAMNEFPLDNDIHHPPHLQQYNRHPTSGVSHNLPPFSSVSSSLHSYSSQPHSASASPTIIKDLDHFFIMFYKYYYHKGLGVILLTEFCSVLSLGFTVFFTTFLIGLVNWSLLINECSDEMTCSAISSEVIINPFHEKPSLWRLSIMIYFLLLFSYWIYQCRQSLQTAKEAFEMDEFYRESLKIPFLSLEDYQWYEILEKVISLYENDRFPYTFMTSSLYPNIQRDLLPDDSEDITDDRRALMGGGKRQDRLGRMVERLNPSKLTIQNVILRIMRKENYLIALMNRNQLNLYLPWWISPYTTESLFMSKSMEWSLNFCLFENMFNDQYEIPSSFFDISTNGENLTLRFQLTGMILLLILPFSLIFMIFHFFLENATYFHSTKSYLGPRTWTAYALWKYREFNELPHIFNQRMNKGISSGSDYLNLYYNSYLNVLAKFISYVSGAMIAMILLLSLINEEALMYFQIADHNLLWYLGIFSAIYALSRGILSSSDDSSKIMDSPKKLLEKMSSFTHDYPQHWIGKEHTSVVRHEVSSELLVYKIQLFFIEISGVILTPIILMFSLPRCTPALLEFLK
jgi:autophagy-related protein 9